MMAKAAAFPKGSLIVQEHTTDLLLKSCRQGGIDLAIVALPMPAKYLEVEALFEEELLLLLPLDHPLADKPRIRLRDVEPFAGSVSRTAQQKTGGPHCSRSSGLCLTKVE